MNTEARGPWRLCCAGFSEADRAALRSLLGLLTPYLRPPWEEVEVPAQADLCLVRLDGDASPAVSHPRLVGCAQHPRQFASGTLHRPLRAPQLLALLCETGAELSVSLPRKSPRDPAQAQPLLRLLAWPLDAECGPRVRLNALAALSAGPATAAALAASIGTSVHEVERIVEPLRRDGLLASEQHGTVATRTMPSSTPGWRGFMAGLGRRLGFLAT